MAEGILNGKISMSGSGWSAKNTPELRSLLQIVRVKACRAWQLIFSLPLPPPHNAEKL